MTIHELFNYCNQIGLANNLVTSTKTWLKLPDVYNPTAFSDVRPQTSFHSIMESTPTYQCLLPTTYTLYSSSTSAYRDLVLWNSTPRGSLECALKRVRSLLVCTKSNYSGAVSRLRETIVYIAIARTPPPPPSPKDN